MNEQTIDVLLLAELEDQKAPQLALRRDVGDGLKQVCDGAAAPVTAEELKARGRNRL
jgi:hypothetical protein